MIWSILWFLIIFETPAVHPRISPEERKEIEDAIGTSTNKRKPTYVPWKSILTAPCVWAIILTHGTSVFGYFTIVNQLPTYMKTILHYDIKSVRNSLYSSFFFSVKFSLESFFVNKMNLDYINHYSYLMSSRTPFETRHLFASLF